MMYQENYFVVSVKFIFSYRQTLDDQDKFQTVTDTDNECNECETPRK